MSHEILLADDDDSIRFIITKALSRAGYNVKATDNAQTLLKWVQKGLGEIIITDVMMHMDDIFAYLPQLTQARPNIPIIIISANNTVNTALKAGQHKVFEYVPKPFDLDNLITTVRRASQSVHVHPSPPAPHKKLPMIGRSTIMQPVFRAISRFAASDLPILIEGPIGTGKDLVARLLHERGPRHDLPFCRINDFSNLSLTLQKLNGGDLYVDEIAELSMLQQEHLLSLLTETDRIPPPQRPRLLSTTRKNLRQLVETGHFRDDLLYRINVAEIQLPSLIKRGKDIIELAEGFLTQASPLTRRRFSTHALNILRRHNWTGNVRELENLVRRLAILYSDDVISADMVLLELSKDSQENLRRGSDNKLSELLQATCLELLRNTSENHHQTPYQTALEWIEKPLILEALKITGGNRIKAAKILGIHRNTLKKKMQFFKIDGLITSS